MTGRPRRARDRGPEFGITVLLIIIGVAMAVLIVAIVASMYDVLVG